MKKLFALATILLLSLQVFCQNFTESGEILTLDGLSYASDILNEIIFKDSEITLIRYEGYFEEEDHILLHDKYSIEKKDHITFLCLEKERLCP